MMVIGRLISLKAEARRSTGALATNTRVAGRKGEDMAKERCISRLQMRSCSFVRSASRRRWMPCFTGVGT